MASQLFLLFSILALSGYTMACTTPWWTSVLDPTFPALCDKEDRDVPRTSPCSKHCIAKYGTCKGFCAGPNADFKGTGEKRPYHCYCILSPATGGSAIKGGRPIYWTFDGLETNAKSWFTYNGTCKHTTVRQCTKTADFPTFVVSQSNMPLSGNTGMNRVNKLFVSVKEWKFDLEVDTTVPASPVVTINCKKITMPYQRVFEGGKHPGVFGIRMYPKIQSPHNKHYVQIQFSFGLRIYIYYHTMRVYLPQHEQLRGNTCGILGKWDGNLANDLTGRSGTVHSLGSASSIREFGDSWCEKSKPKKCVSTCC